MVQPKNNYQICVECCAKNRLDNTWKCLYFDNMEDIKAFDSKYPNYHRPANDQFYWVVRIASKSLFSKKWKVLRQEADGKEFRITLNNIYDANELIRVIKNRNLSIKNGNIIILSSLDNRIEKYFEPYYGTFKSDKWCKFFIYDKKYVGRTYLTDKFNQDSERMIGCLLEDGGTLHLHYDNQKFTSFEYINI